MLTIVVIIAVYLLFSTCIWWALRNKTVALSWRQSALFLGVKVAAGSLYGYIYGRFYGGDDTWGLNHDAWVQYQYLLREPGRFVGSLFTLHPIRDPALYFGDCKTVLEYWEYAFVTRIMAPFNCISQGNYYINVVFFCFISFWGAYLLTRMFANEGELTPISTRVPGPQKSAHPHSRKLAVPIGVTIAVYLFLPAVFWLSGIRAEGLILLFTGLLLFYFRRWISRPRTGNTMLCLAAFALLFILRSGFALTLAPALLAWWLSNRFRIRPVKAFAGVYMLVALLVAVSSFLPPAYNLLRPVVSRQQAFAALHGNTRFNLTPLQDNIGSFAAVAPEALVNTLLRPWPWEAKGALQWLVTLENVMVWTLIAVVAIRYRRSVKEVFRHPLAWALLCIALSNYLFIGYIVPFPGAIVRYRVMPELFLLCLLGISLKKESD